MIIEVITLASGFAAGIVFDRNVKISASPESQRIALRLLQTGWAQLPTIKDWAVGQIASAQAKALPSVSEVSDEVLKEIEEDIASMTKSSANHLAEVSIGFEKELMGRFDASQTSVLGSK